MFYSFVKVLIINSHQYFMEHLENIILLDSFLDVDIKKIV